MQYANAPLETASEVLDRSARSFFGAMAGFILLDIILLFWVLSPFSGLTAETHAYSVVDRQAMMGAPPELQPAAKPSPLGPPEHARMRQNRAGNRINTTPAFAEVDR